MTISELHDRVKAAVKGVVGTPEGQALIREAVRLNQPGPLVNALNTGLDDAFKEVCAFMDARPGTPRNPRW
jgi:hypothetical protein